MLNLVPDPDFEVPKLFLAVGVEFFGRGGVKVDPFSAAAAADSLAFSTDSESDSELELEEPDDDDAALRFWFVLRLESLPKFELGALSSTIVFFSITISSALDSSLELLELPSSGALFTSTSGSESSSDSSSEVLDEVDPLELEPDGALGSRFIWEVAAESDSSSLDSDSEAKPELPFDDKVRVDSRSVVVFLFFASKSFEVGWEGPDSSDSSSNTRH